MTEGVIVLYKRIFVCVCGREYSKFVVERIGLYAKCECGAPMISFQPHDITIQYDIKADKFMTK